MPGTEAFVAEIPVDLEYPLHATHDKALEVEFWRYTQVHIDIERVMMGLEGSSRRAARYHLQHWRLDLNEGPLSKIIANAVDYFRANFEGPSGLLVDEQIEIASPIPGFGISQTLELVR